MSAGSQERQQPITKSLSAAMQSASAPGQAEIPQTRLYIANGSMNFVHMGEASSLLTFAASVAVAQRYTKAVGRKPKQ